MGKEGKQFTCFVLFWTFGKFFTDVVEELSMLVHYADYVVKIV